MIIAQKAGNYFPVSLRHLKLQELGAISGSKRARSVDMERRIVYRGGQHHVECDGKYHYCVAPGFSTWKQGPCNCFEMATFDNENEIYKRRMIARKKSTKV